MGTEGGLTLMSGKSKMPSLPIICTLKLARLTTQRLRISWTQLCTRSQPCSTVKSPCRRQRSRRVRQTAPPQPVAQQCVCTKEPRQSRKQRTGPCSSSQPPSNSFTWYGLLLLSTIQDGVMKGCYANYSLYKPPQKCNDTPQHEEALTFSSLQSITVGVGRRETTLFQFKQFIPTH